MERLTTVDGGCYNQIAARNGGRQGELRGGYFRPLDYKGRRVMCMNTYETFMVIIGFMNCLLIVLISWINSMKK